MSERLRDDLGDCLLEGVDGGDWEIIGGGIVPSVRRGGDNFDRVILGLARGRRHRGEGTPDFREMKIGSGFSKERLEMERLS